MGSRSPVAYVNLCNLSAIRPGQSITTEAQSMTLYDPIAIVLHSAQNEFYARESCSTFIELRS